MKVCISAALVFAVFAATTTAQAAAKGAKTRSTSVVIDSPADLPELAQRRSEAMYLHSTGSGQAFLYLEQDQGEHSQSSTLLTQRPLEKSDERRLVPGPPTTLFKPWIIRQYSFAFVTAQDLQSSILGNTNSQC